MKFKDIGLHLNCWFPIIISLAVHVCRRSLEPVFLTLMLAIYVFIKHIVLMGSTSCSQKHHKAYGYPRLSPHLLAALVRHPMLEVIEQAI